MAFTGCSGDFWSSAVLFIGPEKLVLKHILVFDPHNVNVCRNQYISHLSTRVHSRRDIRDAREEAYDFDFEVTSKPPIQGCN
jgi:hypothetical protein